MGTERGVTAESMLPLPEMPGRRAHRVRETPAARAAGRARFAGAGRNGVEADSGHARAETEAPLPRQYFVQLLRREKRRADRTQQPLSIIVFRSSSGSGRDVGSLLALVAGCIRETDVLGQLGNGAVAVLCPDTHEAGAHSLIEKVGRHGGYLAYSAETATYPDQHFEELAAGEWSPSASHPLFMESHAQPRQDGYRLKRLLDVIGATLAIVVLAPVMLAVAIAVRLSSPGPIIFRQTRLGQYGVPFTFFKFRSMRINNDDSAHRSYVKSLIKGEHEQVNQQTAGDPLYKMKADPRITPVGRFIRRTSLDELPQLFNVLRGDMSLVGPRPPIPYEAESYRSWHLRRVLDIRPGITGLWQVEGRSRVSFDEMVRMDLRYFRSCSLALDLSILVRTVRVVLRCEGAR